MDKSLEERVNLLEAENQKLKKTNKFFYFMIFCLLITSSAHLFKKNDISFNEDDYDKKASFGFNSVEILDKEIGVASMQLNPDKTQSLSLSNSFTSSRSHPVRAGLHNSPKVSTMALMNKGTVSARAKEFPELDLVTANNGWFKIGFSKDGTPQFNFGGSNRKSEFTLTLEDFKKLKKLNF